MAGNGVRRKVSEFSTSTSSSPGRSAQRRSPPRVVQVARPPRPSGLDERGDTREVVLLDAQVQVPPRLVDEACEPLGQWLARRATEDLVEQVTVGEGVLGDTGAGRMDRSGVRQEVHERLAVVVPEVLGLGRERRETRLVGEQVPHRGGALARAGELGPDGGHRLVEADGTLAHGVEERQRGEGLGDREGHHQRVGGPRRGPVAQSRPSGRTRRPRRGRLRPRRRVPARRRPAGRARRTGGCSRPPP